MSPWYSSSLINSGMAHPPASVLSRIEPGERGSLEREPGPCSLRQGCAPAAAPVRRVVSLGPRRADTHPEEDQKTLARRLTGPALSGMTCGALIHGESAR